MHRKVRYAHRAASRNGDCNPIGQFDRTAQSLATASLSTNSHPPGQGMSCIACLTAEVAATCRQGERERILVLVLRLLFLLLTGHRRSPSLMTQLR
eukprot:753299-Hanusia_phi.AAC.9